jgi:hypothetical protein
MDGPSPYAEDSTRGSETLRQRTSSRRRECPRSPDKSAGPRARVPTRWRRDPRAAFCERIAYGSRSGPPLTRSEARCGRRRAAHPSGIAPSAPDCRSSGPCIASGRCAAGHRRQRPGRGHRLNPAAEPCDTPYRAPGWRTRRTDRGDPVAASDRRARPAPSRLAGPRRRDDRRGDHQNGDQQDGTPRAIVASTRHA